MARPLGITQIKITVVVSSSSSLLVWEFFLSAVAALGGVSVFVGLWMEKKGEKNQYRDIEDFRSSKAKREIGWWILMAGIFVEIVVAVVFAVREDLEMREVKSNAPMKQSVGSIKAQVYLEIFGTNSDSYADLQDEEQIAKLMGQLRLIDKDGTVLAGLSCDGYETAETGFPPEKRRRRVLSMTFTWPHAGKPWVGMGERIAAAPISVENLLRQVTGARIEFPGSKAHDEIYKGSGVFTINQAIQKEFLAPKDPDGVFLIKTNKP